MPDWSDMPEDEAPLKDWSDDTDSTAVWDNDANKGNSAWNDDPKVDETADSVFEESYETPEAPADPVTDEFGRAAGLVKVILRFLFSLLKAGLDTHACGDRHGELKKPLALLAVTMAALSTSLSHELSGLLANSHYQCVRPQERHRQS